VNKKQKLLVGVLVLFLVAIFGCAAVQNAVIPMYINPEVGEYTGECMISWMPWTSIWDGDRLAAKMKFLHEANLIELERAAEDDTKYYGFLTDAMILDRQDAVALKSAVFSPSGPLGMLLTGLPMFGLGAMLISKPEDKKKITALQNGSK
jgi:hypothetical protein